MTFDGIPAPVLYAGANQINAVVPYAVGSAATQMAVQFNQQSYGPIVMPVAAAVPGIFTLDGSGHGQAAVLNQDGTFNSIANPAARGSIITFFACGYRSDDARGCRWLHFAADTAACLRRSCPYW